MRFKAWWLGVRVAVAQWVLVGTKYEVTYQPVRETIAITARRLDEYVQKSGGLRSPHRIRAYREVRRELDTIQSAAEQLPA